MEMEYGVGLQLTYESNIDRAQTNGRSELTEDLIAGALLREVTPELNARLLVQLDKRHFSRHTFSDDTTGYLDGNAVWTIVPRRLTWVAEDIFRQVQLALTAPDTPSNRTETNSFNTGPDLTFAVSTANSLLLGARYGRFDIKDSINDNQRYQGYARVVHAISPQTALSLNYEAVRVQFEPGAQLFEKILRKDFYGRFETLTAGDGATLDAGKTNVIRYGGDPLDGHIARLTLIKAVSRQLAVRITYSDQLSDTYSDLIRGVTGASTVSGSGAPSAQEPGVVLIAGDATANGDIYRSKLGTAGLVNHGGSMEYTVYGVARSVDFTTLDQDYDEKGGRMVFDWIYTGAVRFRAVADYLKRTFVTLERTDTDRNYGVGAEFLLNRNLMFTFAGGRLERQSTLPGNSFVDNKVVLLLGYNSGRFDLRTRR